MRFNNRVLKLERKLKHNSDYEIPKVDVKDPEQLMLYFLKLIFLGFKFGFFYKHEKYCAMDEESIMNDIHGLMKNEMNEFLVLILRLKFWPP